jgi:hypothetical protein
MQELANFWSRDHLEENLLKFGYKSNMKIELNLVINQIWK